MKKSRFSAEEISKILKEWNRGRDIDELASENNVSKQTLYLWRRRFGGLQARELKRIREIEEENVKLRRAYLNMSMELDKVRQIVERLPQYSD